MTELGWLKFVATLAKTKIKQNMTSKAEIILNESDIDDLFQSIYAIVISYIQFFFTKIQAWLLIQLLIKMLVFQSIII